MATLAKSAVSLYGSGNAAKIANQFHAREEELVYRRLTLVLTGQGGATNTISASALGFDTLVDCSPLWDSTNSKGYPAVVDPAHNVIILLDGSAAPAPVDVTSSAAYITVLGTTRTSAALT
jgi:hypothetical protein